MAPPKQYLGASEIDIPQVTMSDASTWAGPRWWQTIWRAHYLTTIHHCAAITDQIIVSGAGFMLTFALGRWSTPTELGLYSLSMTWITSLGAIQDSMLIFPYTFAYHRSAMPERSSPMTYLTLSFLLGLAGALFCVAAVSLYPVTHPSATMPRIPWLCAIALRPYVVRDFCRRASLAVFDFVSVLKNDICYIAIQFGLTCVICIYGQIDAQSAYFCLAISTIVPAALAISKLDGHAIQTNQVIIATLRDSWQSGQWLLASQLSLIAQNSLNFWLIFHYIGAAETGIYAACVSIVMLASPITTGISNILAPRSAQASLCKGGTELRARVKMDSVILGAIMVAFTIVVASYSDGILTLLYGHSNFHGHAYAITTLSMAALFAAVGTPSSNALAALNRGPTIFTATAIALGITLVSALLLLPIYGINGAATGLMLGHLAGAVARLSAFWRYQSYTRSLPVKQDSSSITLQDDQTLRSLFTSLPYDYTNARVTRLGAGAESHVYLVSPNSLAFDGICDPQIAVKLFDRRAISDQKLLLQIFRTQALYDALDGMRHDGWTYRIPKILTYSITPPAIVMSRVSGKTLNSLMIHPGLPAEPDISKLARTLVAGLAVLWAQRKSHGDLNFDNVLLDQSSRTISLIDPGPSTAGLPHVHFCDEYGPAIGDLSYLLFEVSLGFPVYRMVGHDSQPARLAILLVRAFIESQMGNSTNDALRHAFRATTLRYVMMLRPEASLRGLWLRYLRSVAMRRIQFMLDQAFVCRIPGQPDINQKL